MHRIIRGDALRLLPRQPAESAQLLLVDPPYGVRYRSTLGERVLNDDRPFIWWLHEAYRLTAPGGSLVCFTRWDVAEVFRLAIELAGFRVRSQVVWHKPGGGMGDTRQQFAPSHEVAWFAVKGKFAFPAGRPMSVTTHVVPRGPTRTHPCQKPVSLLVELIEATTRPGDLVLDPFCGTGASIVACVRTGRRGLGMELDHKHAAKARQRVAHERTLHARGEHGPDA
jgi:site-specific DNA-methyltransferase (adenine-specific)